MLMSAVLLCPRTLTFLVLVACGWPLPTSPTAACDDLPGLADLTHPYDSIFSPLLKALSEHGRSRWSPELRRKMKPEERYMKYLADVYKKTSRVQRSLEGRRRCNTLRLIKPKDECFGQSDKGESFNMASAAHIYRAPTLYRQFSWVGEIKSLKKKRTQGGNKTSLDVVTRLEQVLMLFSSAALQRVSCRISPITWIK